MVYLRSLLSIVFALFKNIITRDGFEEVIRIQQQKNNVISKWEFGVTLRETYYHAKLTYNYALYIFQAINII